MNRVKVLLSLCTCILLSKFDAAAQYQFQFSFRGTCWTTNASGNMVARAVTSRNWLQDYAKANGIANLRSLAVAYHVGGNELGDAIEIVNATNGVPLTTLFGLYFGEAFGRMALTNGPGTQQQRLEYLYTSQNSHALGDALLTQQVVLDRNGQTNRIQTTGQMQYTVLSTAATPSEQVCSGTFTTGAPIIRR